MNVLERAIIQTPFGEEDSCAKLTIDDTTLPFIFHNISHADETYTLSFYVRSESEGSIMVGGVTINTTSEWTRHVVKFVADSVSVPMYFRTVGTYYLYETQIEIGDHATDYRPAVEDLEEEVSDAKSIAIQTREMFKWIVKSGESASEFTLTDRMATLIADTISLNGKVKVNGEMLVDGTITSDKIDVTDLFAQDITATGKIRGVELIGAKGTFTGELIIEDGVGHRTHIDAIGNINLIDTTDNIGTTSLIAITKGDTAISMSSLGTLSAYNSVEGKCTSVSVGGFQTYDETYELNVLPYNIYIMDKTTESVITSLAIDGIYTSGDITASTFNGNLNGRASSATTASQVSGVLADGTKTWTIRTAGASPTQSLSIVVNDGSSNVFHGLLNCDSNGNITRNWVPVSGGTFTGNVTIGKTTFGTDGTIKSTTSVFELSSSGASAVLASHFRPKEDNVMSLGRSNYKWTQLYATTATIETSDKNEKYDFRTFNEAYEKFFFDLKPTIYKFIKGTSGRDHFGFISQDVEESLFANGFNDKSFGGFCKDEKVEYSKDLDGNEVVTPILSDSGEKQYIYGLRYEEFIALNTHMIQKLYLEIENLKQEIAMLKSK